MTSSRIFLLLFASCYLLTDSEANLKQRRDFLRHDSNMTSDIIMGPYLSTMSNTQGRPRFEVHGFPGEKVWISPASTIGILRRPKVLPIPGSCHIARSVFQNGEAIPPTHVCKTNCQCVNSRIFCDDVICEDLPHDHLSESCRAVPKRNQCCPSWECDITNITDFAHLLITENTATDTSEDGTKSTFHVETSSPSSTDLTTSSEQDDHDPHDGHHNVSEEGYCYYNGAVYHPTQEIPRKDPCGACFCYKGEIICFPQSCPPPIHGCYSTPIEGFCCPRFHCPVHEMHFNSSRTTTTTADPTSPKKLASSVLATGCEIEGHMYRVQQVVGPASGSCMVCRCESGGVMKCDPKECYPHIPITLRLNPDFFGKEDSIYISFQKHSS